MKILDIYTDGSHLDKQNNGRLGCGGVLVDQTAGGAFGKINAEFSEELTPEFLRRTVGSSKVSNPTAEMLGLLLALRKFKYEPGIDYVFHIDYIGVKAWMEGTWKIKEPHIRAAKDAIDREIQSKRLAGRVRVEWVKGHQSKSILSKDAYWNDYVDKLAKGI